MEIRFEMLYRYVVTGIFQIHAFQTCWRTPTPTCALILKVLSNRVWTCTDNSPKPIFGPHTFIVAARPHPLVESHS